MRKELFPYIDRHELRCSVQGGGSSTAQAIEKLAHLAAYDSDDTHVNHMAIHSYNQKQDFPERREDVEDTKNNY